MLENFSKSMLMKREERKRENDVINKKIFKRVTLNTPGVTLVLHLHPIQIKPQRIGKV